MPLTMFIFKREPEKGSWLLHTEVWGQVQLCLCVRMKSREGPMGGAS